MSEAVLVDLIHGCGPDCSGSLLQDSASHHVFLLGGKRNRDKNGFTDALLSSCRSVHVLDSGSTAECLYRFKQTVDQLDLSSIRVLTTPRGRDALRLYQDQLFTEVYSFTYLTCPSCAGPAHTDSPGQAAHGEEDLSRFVQRLPGLRGQIRVLRSTLIPGWKGTVMGVAMATVEAMVKEFGCRASDIMVAVGPSVGACCFTLEREQALHLQRIHPDCVPDPESARPHVNIRLANRILLQRGGVLPQHIHDDAVTERPGVTPCTSCQPEHFFSHVRDGPNFGTQVGFLWIRETD